MLHSLQAQSKYWIYFSDKHPWRDETLCLSAQTRANRAMLELPAWQLTDQPPNPEYLGVLRHHNVILKNQSKWLNAVTALLDPQQLGVVRELPFVKAIVPVNPNVSVGPADPGWGPEFVYSPALQQVHGKAFADAGLTGKNVVIGVIDIGFIKADLHPFLQHIFRQGQVLGHRDFIMPANPHFFVHPQSRSDRHGAVVMQMITGWNPRINTQTGVARDASFYLARTDHGQYEFRGEEDNWVAALEWLDSLGVRLVHTSLNYSIDLDDPRENHKPEEMNGNSTAISKAAKIASEEKGMIIVNSAGNDGDNPAWQFVSAPADVEGVITVGTLDHQGGRAPFSGTGPAFLNYVKPNLACVSLGKTSFSAPVITGMVACMLQYDKSLSSRKVREMLEKSGHLYPFGNNYIGYGAPDARKIVGALTNAGPARVLPQPLPAKSGSFTLSGLGLAEEVMVFHKQNAHHVIRQEVIKVQGEQVTISRTGGAAYTTVSTKDKVFEIKWP